MNVRVSDVKKWAGREERTTLCEPWPELVEQRLDGSQMDQPGVVQVLVRNVGSGLLVDVSGQAHIHLSCARCLGDAKITVAFSDSQEFREEPGAEDSTLDYGRFIGDHICLDEMVADAVALEVPFAPLCMLDCQGLCPQCGINWNVSTCTCKAPADTRWDRLKTFSDTKDSDNA